MVTRFITKNKKKIPITDRSAGLKLRIPSKPSSGAVQKKVQVTKAFAGGDDDFWQVQVVHVLDGDIIAVPESDIVKGKDKAEALRQRYESQL